VSYDGYISLQVAPKPVPPADLPKADEWKWWEEQPSWEIGLSELGNYTSNVSGMWTRALTAVAPDLDGVDIPEDGLLALRDTQGWTCRRAAPLTALADEGFELPVGAPLPEDYDDADALDAATEVQWSDNQQALQRALGKAGLS